MADEPKRAADGEFEPGKEDEKKPDEHRHGETADEKKKREEDEARKRHK
jgi:hypothetical protein